MMKAFIRNDGQAIAVVPGFREQMLSLGAGVTPRPEWGDAKYQKSAAKKRRRAERLHASFAKWLGPLSGVRQALDIGCGDAANCVLLAEAGVNSVTGIDLTLPLSEDTEKGRRSVRLLASIMGTPLRPGAGDQANGDKNFVDGKLKSFGVSLLAMDATSLKFDDGSFDLIISRSAMEHIQPPGAALAEMARVTRPGALIYLAIDPFFWLRGCHKRGIVDIPWAHARLTQDEYRRFVTEYEDAARADSRDLRLETLNRFTVAQWEELISQMPCHILDWRERPSAVGEELLIKYPEILDTLLKGVTRRDLLCERIEVWLRRA